jgi:hypothetical protein
MQIKVGQELEFIESVRLEGKSIEPGTRVRIGFILNEVVEPQVTVVVLGKEPPDTLTVPRHVLTMHCIPVGEDA